MPSLDYPQLEAAIPGRCASDSSVTRTQLPCGDYLCPACVRMYRERGWLDADFEHTELFFAEHQHVLGLRVRRKDHEKGISIDPELLREELRRLLASGESVETALHRLQSEAHVGYFHLAAAVSSVLGLPLREARRLVVQVIGGGGSGGQ